MIKNLTLTTLCLLLFAQIALAQTNYVYPTDTAVANKLERWRDLKFGVIIHWGLYAQAGIMESWTLCAEDWITRDTTQTYEEYKNWYWGLKDQFNPTLFNANHWAKMAKNAGMKYLVFTTKHHDGFAMFNTKQSDFSIAQGPFKNNANADVAKHVFDAFRNNGLMIGAYFSKPDWHCSDYWWPVYPTADRNVNYDIRKFPNRWNNYKHFTFNQVDELMSNYGKIDILWLDGGWVRPLETVNDEVKSWGCRIPAWSQDIDIPSLAKMARAKQNGLLIVDRTVHGEFENYRTPEQQIPTEQLSYPWESCLTLANNWGYVPNDTYKSSTQIIHTLIEVTAKGGNLLLGIGPKADGTIDDTSQVRLKEIGAWLDKNQQAIYETRCVKNYHQNHIWFTKNKNNNTHYALVLNTNNATNLVEWEGNIPAANAKLILLHNNKPLKWVVKGNKVNVQLPKNAFKNQAAIAISISELVNN